jgi:hypothetical protein
MLLLASKLNKAFVQVVMQADHGILERAKLWFPQFFHRLPAPHPLP